MKSIAFLALVLFSSLSSFSQERMIGLTRNYNLGSGGILRLDSTGADYSILPYFTEPPHGIVGKPLLHSNGKIYAATGYGGNLSKGTILSWNPDGSDVKIEYNFGEPDQVGYTPAGGLTEGEDGSIFGIIGGDRQHRRGMIFQFNPSKGTCYTRYHYSSLEAAMSESRLISTSGEWLYGTSRFGGLACKGTVYRFSQETDSFEVVYEFPEQLPNDPSPYLTLHLGGKLYGYCTESGSEKGPTLFRLAENSTQIEFLESLPAEVIPIGELLTDRNGNLYGVSSKGGLYDAGMIFRTDSLGKRFVSLHSFGGDNMYLFPQTGLEWGSNGLLHGFIRNSGSQKVSLYQINTYGDDFEILKTSAVDRLERLNSSFLYTSEGCWGTGTAGDPATYLPYYQSELIFHLNPSASTQKTPFYTDHFSHNGYQPRSGLKETRDQSILGVTRNGGKYHRGTLYKTDRCGNNFQVLYDFQDVNIFWRANGIFTQPDGSLLAFGEGRKSMNTSKLIRIDPESGTDSLLHEFLEYDAPPSSIISHTDGYMYGIGRKNHTSIPDSLIGAVFRVDSDGSNFTELVTFQTGRRYFSTDINWLSHSNGRIYGTSYGYLIEFDPKTLDVSFRDGNFSEEFSYSIVAPIEGPDQQIYGVGNEFFSDPYTASYWIVQNIWKIHPDTGNAFIHHDIRGYWHFPSVDGALAVSPDSTITGVVYFDSYPGYGPESYQSVVFSVDTTGNHYTEQKVVRDSTGHYLVGNLLYLPGGECPPVNAPEIDDDPPILATDVQVGVYPNPVQDILIVKMDEIPIEQITLYDLQGKEMIVSVSGSDLDHSSILQLEYLPAGVYVVLIHTPDEVFKRKILKL